MRVGLPLAGAGLGWKVTSGPASDADIPPGAAGALVGLIVGVITASSIDADALAGAEEPPARITHGHADRSRRVDLRPRRFILATVARRARGKACNG